MLRFRAIISSRFSSSNGSNCSATKRRSRFINRTGTAAIKDCRTRIPVAFANASSRRRFSCSALKLASAFGACFFGRCTGQAGSVQTFRSSPLSMPSETMASVVYLHVLNSRNFAFCGVSGFSSRISTYLLRGMVFPPSGCCLYAVLIWTSSGLAATLALYVRVQLGGVAIRVGALSGIWANRKSFLLAPRRRAERVRRGHPAICSSGISARGSFAL
jgi:hypothetical protein